MRAWLLILILLSTLTLGGCEVIGDIFQAGMAVGVILVLVLVGAVVFIARKLRK